MPSTRSVLVQQPTARDREGVLDAQAAFPPYDDIGHQLDPHIHMAERGPRAGEKLPGREHDRVIRAEAPHIRLGDQPDLLVTKVVPALWASEVTSGSTAHPFIHPISRRRDGKITPVRGLTRFLYRSISVHS